jgi:hypothetical protein
VWGCVCSDPGGANLRRGAWQSRSLEVLANPAADAPTLAERLGRDLDESGAGTDQAVLDPARRLLTAGAAAATHQYGRIVTRDNSPDLAQLRRVYGH